MAKAYKEHLTHTMMTTNPSSRVCVPRESAKASDHFNSFEPFYFKTCKNNLISHYGCQEEGLLNEKPSSAFGAALHPHASPGQRRPTKMLLNSTADRGSLAVTSP